MLLHFSQQCSPTYVFRVVFLKLLLPLGCRRAREVALQAAGCAAAERLILLLQEDTFQQYVKPEINPKLSDFCISLTGITQDIVDKADIFPQVLQNVVEWMRQRELGTKYSYSMLSDGSWNMSKFLNIQCRISCIKYPSFAKKWINIRKSYGNVYKVPRNQTKLTIMLENLGMSYDGRPHSGLDDSKSIARIAVRMLQDGCALRVNERIHGGQLMTVSSSGPLEGAPAPQMPRYRN
ncbi:3'-5' exoribonuclease 1-like [Agelaius tricolor]|uniref:3'-5' exoribonuclease 1-like n=1 Tax=Agelaius tricolor TaxID=9191 RepID=UPI0039F1A447